MTEVRSQEKAVRSQKTKVGSQETGGWRRKRRSLSNRQACRREQSPTTGLLLLRAQASMTRESIHFFERFCFLPFAKHCCYSKGTYQILFCDGLLFYASDSA